MSNQLYTVYQTLLFVENTTSPKELTRQICYISINSIKSIFFLMDNYLLWYKLVFTYSANEKNSQCRGHSLRLTAHYIITIIKLAHSLYNPDVTHVLLTHHQGYSQSHFTPYWYRNYTILIIINLFLHMVSSWATWKALVLQPW